MSNQTFTIIKTRNNRQNETTGTIEELKKHFSYTLSCGNSYNKKISTAPKTIKTLVKSLNQSVDYTQQGSFNPDHYELKTV